MSVLSGLVGMVTGNVVPALVGAGLTFGLGFAAAEAMEHGLNINAGFVHIQGLGPKLATRTLERDAWKSASGAWQADAGAWKASFRASEGLRKDETSKARTAVDEGQKACDARVAEAKRSALAIHALVTKEPKRDAQGCPIPGLLDPRSLRDALQAGSIRPR